MAFIHKATVYFIDPNEEFDNTKAIAEEMRTYDSLPYMKIRESETKDFNWDDEVIVNRGDCTGEQAEIFFQNVKPKEVIPTYWYRVLLSEDGVESSIYNIGNIRYQNVYETSTISARDTVPKPIYWIDVEAASLEQAEDIAKEKVLEYINNKRLKDIEDIRRKFFNK